MTEVLNCFDMEAYVRNTRRLIQAEKPVIQLAPSLVLQHWDAWVYRALEGLREIHKAGFVHGNLDVPCLVIDNGELYITCTGNLFRKGDAPAHEFFQARNLVHPPERLLWDGKAEGMTFSRMWDALDTENPNIDRFGLLFPDLMYSRSTLQRVFETQVTDFQSGDVWMMGRVLLTVYLGLLEWPYVMSTEFYRTRHDMFMEMLEHMLAPVPAQRWTAAEAVAFWSEGPDTDTSSEDTETTQEDEEDENEEEEDKENADGTRREEENVGNAELPTSSSASTSESVAASTNDVQSNSDPPYRPGMHPMRRLVLSGQRDPAGRSKTRKSSRSSGRSSATGSRGTRKRG
jgi:hypothetical protein